MAGSSSSTISPRQVEAHTLRKLPCELQRRPSDHLEGSRFDAPCQLRLRGIVDELNSDLW